jgi:RING-box protein 1
MADVDMADAPPAKTKVAKAAASSEGDKKRFEVKKVRIGSWRWLLGTTNMS